MTVGDYNVRVMEHGTDELKKKVPKGYKTESNEGKEGG